MVTLTYEMKKYVYNLSQKQHMFLVDALRRYECFTVRSGNGKWNLADLQKALTGLGYKTEFKPVTEAGLMVVNGKYAPRCYRWYRLTEAGAKIVLRWHKQGYKCDSEQDYCITKLPPYYETTPLT